MALQPGSRLGVFEIQELIGAGGMGRVYRARDARLGRDVAIKVLPDEVSADPERRARFEREAKAVSILNHPHICTLYDVGYEDGTFFLVLEHLEGETLAERLKKGPLPLKTALEVAIQIADALDAAHRRGIVHRDLKPGNVMVTREGVKLLDFGLAKKKGHTSEIPEDSRRSTHPMPLTGAGSFLGTVQYMAPEQLEGKDVDARADHFAFGAVLYEMLTGRRAFEGGSQASLIAAILQSDPPPPSKLQSLSPPELDRLVATCLAKDPDERWQSARDVERELEWIARQSIQNVELKGMTPRRTALALAAVLLIGATLPGVVFWSFTGTSPPTVTRFVVSLPESDRLVSEVGRPLALSPDGRTLVYAASHDGKIQLYRRSLAEFGPFLIAGTEGGRAPFFSPDGEWIGFEVGRTLRKVPVMGGHAVTLCESPGSIRGASWGAAGIVFSVLNSSLWLVPAGGGAPQPFTLPDRENGELGHLHPNFLPDGESVLFTLWTDSLESAEWAAFSPRTGEKRVFVPGLNPRYIQTGHVVFERGFALWAVGFDAKSLRTEGEAFPVNVPARVVGGSAQFALAGNGTLAYVSGTESESALLWVDRDGSESLLVRERGTFQYPRVSPDGERLSVTFADPAGHREIYIYDVKRGGRERLTHTAGSAQSEWSPDGTRVAFIALREDSQGMDIFWQPANGGGKAEALLSRPFLQAGPSWSSDGKYLAYHENRPDTTRDIWVMAGDGVPEAFVVSPFNERSARFSPQGSWIAYVSDESGQDEIYVREYPEGGRHLVSASGGTEPAWSRNGDEIFYRHGDSIMSARVRTEGRFEVDAARPLFDGSFEPDRSTAMGHTNYDVSSDGTRFLMVRSGPPDAHRQIRVVLNWAEELKQLDPKR
jgi:serine/threonine protein kinase/Tol biopolymer transport system component